MSAKSTNRSSNKILFIAYYFPPAGSVGTFRNYNLARILSSNFAASHLITPLKRPFPLEEEFDTSFVNIHEIKHQDYRTIFKSSTSSKKARVNNSSSKETFKRIVSRKILDSYPGNILWGEGGITYISNSLSMAKRIIKEEGITHIYSSFRPMADHYIAFRLKKHFPHLSWCADFRDLPVDRNRNNVFFPRIMEKLYRSIFKKADLLTTVSGGLLDIIHNYNKNAIVVNNGLRELFQPKQVKKPFKFTLTYTGSLYPGQQDPDPFFRAMQNLITENKIEQDQIQIVYAGKDHGLWEEKTKQYSLTSISTILQKVSLSKAIELQHKSHINILFTWSGPHSGGVVTGKFYEYLAAGKAILCLVNGKKDSEIESLFEKYSAGKVYYGNEKNIQNWLEELYLEWKTSGKSSFSMDKKALQSLSWENSGNQLIKKWK